MAKDKKSFIAYGDWMCIFDHLSDAEAGILIKHVFRYVNDQNPELKKRFLKIAFEPIKQSLKRDLKKWENEKGNRSDSGNLGNLKRWHPELHEKVAIGELDVNEAVKIAKIAGATSATKKIANVAVNVNDNVNVNVKNKRERENKFSPPAKEDVVELMFEKLDEFSAMGEADKFINFYQSKNWMVGKTKMKDWRAAARGWLSRMNDFKNEKNGKRKQGTSELQNEALKNF